MTVDKVYIVCDSALKDENEEDKTNKKVKLYVDVINTRTGEIEAQGSVNVKDIKDKSHKFSKISLNKAFKPKQNALYEFRYYTKSNDTVYFTLEEDTTPLATYYRTRQKIIRRHIVNTAVKKKKGAGDNATCRKSEIENIFYILLLRTILKCDKLQIVMHI